MTDTPSCLLPLVPWCVLSTQALMLRANYIFRVDRVVKERSKGARVSLDENNTRGKALQETKVHLLRPELDVSQASLCRPQAREVPHESGAAPGAGVPPRQLLCVARH